MNADAHRAKAERIGRSLSICRTSDYEVVIDGAMLAISHWINFAFHRLDLTVPENDIMHCYFVTGFDRQYFGLAAGPEFLDALEEVDRARPLYVRGNVAGGDKAAERALKLQALVRDKALAVAHQRSS
jgi:hypothetical protein